MAQRSFPPVMGSVLELADAVRTFRVYVTGDTVFHSPLSDYLTECERRVMPTMVRPVRRGETVPLTA